jgi:hypothetical protein
MPELHGYGYISLDCDDHAQLSMLAFFKQEVVLLSDGVLGRKGEVFGKLGLFCATFSSAPRHL